MTDETNPEYTDTQVEDLFEDSTEVGNEDVQGKGEEVTLTLDELNNLAGRKDNPFKTKEEFTKHYGNLKNFVGKKQAPVKSDDSSTKEELSQLKAELAEEKFVNTNPTAKAYLPIVKAYAEKQGVSLSEAWSSEEFKGIAESSQKKVLITNNRISPLQSKNIQELTAQARSGSEAGKQELVKEWFGKK